MKRIITLAITLITLIALAACTAPRTPTAPAAVATSTPQAAMPNPASVYCTQQGNKLEIRTAADGSQSGICVFPDGSTCDEWAYYRGECGPTAQTSSTPIATVEATIEASGGTEENGSGGYMPPGASEEISDWWGVIKSNPTGAESVNGSETTRPGN
jgi:putative hemolysin